MNYDYECPICHNIFPSQNKIMHEARCTIEKPMPLDSSFPIQFKNNQEQTSINLNNTKENSEIIEKNKNKDEQFNPEFNLPQNKSYNQDDLSDIFYCEICDKYLPVTIKKDHIYCHNLEKEEKIDNKNILKFNQEQIEEQIKIEELLNNEILMKKEKQNNLYEQQQKFEKLIKQQKQIEEQRKIEKQIKRQNEMIKARQNQRHNNFNLFHMNPFNFNFKSLFSVPKNPNQYKPISKNIVNELPEIVIENVDKLDNEKKNCLICLENFKNGEKATTLPCIHLFHTYCIKSWLKSKKICPICKIKITENNINI